MFIGVDIGGTKIAAGIVSSNGDLVYKQEIMTEKLAPFETTYESILKLLKSLLQRSETLLSSDEIIEAIGIGIPGVTNPESGDVKRCINLHWNEVPLKKWIERDLSIPVYLANDATVAGMAEFVVGQKNQYQDAVMLTLGTGIGASILTSGDIMLGYHGIASEVGHMIVGENFYPCNCGRNGCLETFSSSTAIISYAEKRIQEGAEGLLKEWQNNLTPIDGAMIFKALRLGDSLAEETINRMCKYLSVGMMNLVTVLDPEIILLGGGLSGAGDDLLNRVLEHFEKLKYYPEIELPKVEIAKLENEAGIIGAAMYAKWKS